MLSIWEVLLVPLADVQSTLLDATAPLGPTRVRLREALGYVLAATAIAPENVPSFDNSAMDGYALRAGDVEMRPAELEVIGTIAAGQISDLTVGLGQAARIMTGAPIPDGADAVVMVEQTETSADRSRVAVLAPVKRGDHVRPAGSDLHKGAVVLDPGLTLGPSHLGLLASVGEDQPEVFRRPVVGVLSTGDELVDPASPLRQGQIWDSNRVALLACLERDRFVPVDLGIVVDDYRAVRERIESALGDCDALLTSGGVSAGDFDHVKRVVNELAAIHGGVSESIGLAIRPAKPFAYAFLPSSANRPTPVLGLPGNPVSSLVSYELLARPVLRRLAGHAEALRPETVGRAAEDFARHSDGKTHFIRVVVAPGSDGVLEARSAGGQGSHQLSAMAGANALAILPDGKGGIRAGEPLSLLVLEHP